MIAHGQTVSGSISNGTAAKGKTVRGTVTMSIPGGLHVNSYRPNSEYAIPTTVRVSSSSGVKIGPVSYPRGRNRKFSFSEGTINVYEGRVSFGFNVTVPPTFRGNTVRVNVTVRSQACTDEVCYPPKTKRLTLTARVI
jgi:thiol:disulfide interchange protein